MRNLRCRLFDIVCAVVMGIVNAGQMDALIAARDQLGFIEQHPYCHRFHSRNHADRIVVAQHAINRFPEMGAHPRQALKSLIEWTECFSPEIPGQNANVVFYFAETLYQALHRTWVHVRVHVADMQYGESIKE